jgi:4-amino-4-deoxy-L-arabinose transferase-like glycosyltransferase
VTLIRHSESASRSLPPASHSRRRLYLAIAVALYLVLTALRIVGPYDFDERDQAKQGFYVIEVAERGAFFLPYDHWADEPATKPPLYNWVAGLLALAWGDVNVLVLRLPAVVSGLGVLLLTFLLGERLFDTRTGFLSSLVLATTLHFSTLAHIARTDMLLCLWMVLALYAFVRMRQEPERRRRWWWLLYVALGLGTVTKGPVALLPLAVIALHASVRRDRAMLRSLRLGYGAAVWFGITMAWFVPAWIVGGRPFYNTVIYDEIVARILATGKRASSAQPLLFLVTPLLSRFMPWVLCLPWAVWHGLRRVDRSRREPWLLLTVWFFGSLLLFSLPSAKRDDYVLPLYPAGAILVAAWWRTRIDPARDPARPPLPLGFPRWLMMGFCVCVLVTVIGLGALAAAFDEARLAEYARAVHPEAELPIRRLHQSFARRREVAFVTSAGLLVAAAAGALLSVRSHSPRADDEPDRVDSPAEAPEQKLRRRLLFASLVSVAGLLIVYYAHLLAPQALDPTGPRQRRLCKVTRRLVRDLRTLRFGYTKRGVQFHLGRNEPWLRPDELRAHLATPGHHAIVPEADYRKLFEPEAGLRLRILAATKKLYRRRTTDRYFLVESLPPAR